MSISETNEYVLPSNPKDRAAIKAGIEEIKVQMMLKMGIDEQIKAIVERLKEELEVPPKVAKKMASTSLKDELKGNEFEKQVIEQDAFEIAYESLFRAEDDSDTSEEE